MELDATNVIVAAIAASGAIVTGVLSNIRSKEASAVTYWKDIVTDTRARIAALEQKNEEFERDRGKHEAIIKAMVAYVQHIWMDWGHRDLPPRPPNELFDLLVDSEEADQWWGKKDK